MPLQSTDIKTQIIPPPIGGLNKRDPLHAMAETDAITLDNWQPENADVRLRYGSSLFVATIAGAGNIVMLHSIYDSNNAVDYLIASGSTSKDVYKITDSGTGSVVENLEATEPTFAYTFDENIYYKARSVSEVYYIYDSVAGTAASASLTNASKYYAIGSYKGALYFTGYSGVPFPSFGYLPVGTIASGTITNFDLSQVSREGGICLFVGSTTRVKSYAEDSLFVAVTSRGEVLLYAGEHPSSDTWTLIGLYKIPRPFGYKSFFYLGGHLYIWTVGGIISLADILSDNQTQGRYNTLSNKIDPLWQELATSTNLSFANFSTVNNRFACAVNQKENLLYLIAPDNYCYCKSLLIDDGGWFRVTGWPAYSIAVANDKTYIGTSDGKILYINDPSASGDHNPSTGATDTIATELQQAYNYLGKPTARKLAKGVKVISEFTGGFSMTIDADFDYDSNTPASVTTETASGANFHKTFCGLAGEGEAISLHQKDNYTATKAVKINAFQLFYQEGDITP